MKRNIINRYSKEVKIERLLNSRRKVKSNLGRILNYIQALRQINP